MFVYVSKEDVEQAHLGCGVIYSSHMQEEDIESADFFVGFFLPSGSFYATATYKFVTDAILRVNLLNGGEK